MCAVFRALLRTQNLGKVRHCASAINLHSNGNEEVATKMATTTTTCGRRPTRFLIVHLLHRIRRLWHLLGSFHCCVLHPWHLNDLSR